MPSSSVCFRKLKEGSLRWRARIPPFTPGNPTPTQCRPQRQYPNLPGVRVAPSGQNARRSRTPIRLHNISFEPEMNAIIISTFMGRFSGRMIARWKKHAFSSCSFREAFGPTWPRTLEGVQPTLAAEGGGRVTVAGKAQLEGQRGQIVGCRRPVVRAQHGDGAWSDSNGPERRLLLKDPGEMKGATHARHGRQSSSVMRSPPGRARPGRFLAPSARSA